jgi:UDP-N-acetylglucosamine transferase subunit ALG13
MIFVTVGTHNKGFDRLVRAMDELARDLDEPVIIQRGSSQWLPQHAQSFEFASSEQIAAYVQQCRVMVCHAAAGSAMQAIAADKPLVLVPRLRRFAEHIDDHQLDIATALDALGRAVSVNTPTLEQMRNAIDQATERCTSLAGPGQLIAAVRGQLNAWQPTPIAPIVK